MHGVTHTLRWIPGHRRRRSADNGAVLIENLDRETCLALLTTVGIGRVGWATADGRAMILPVNFVLDRGSDGDTIVFSTSEGEKLDAVREGRLVTFEVDDVELALRTGWSVLVIGSAEVITSPAQIQRIEQLQLAPWVPLPGRVFVRISAAKITGRRLPLHPGKITVIGRAEP
jgi:nitroimidazol reductase NimA-like FMN-containing flavoprotein (pyridoxamine 5'-phosphate oxidase superfamily)